MLKMTFQRVLLLVIAVLYPLTGFADLTDPTRPPAFSTSMGLYDLSEIMIGPNLNSAIIGGHIFHEGDEFQGITVLEIAPNKVKIKGARGESTLELFPSPLTPVTRATNS